MGTVRYNGETSVTIIFKIVLVKITLLVRQSYFNYDATTVPWYVASWCDHTRRFKSHFSSLKPMLQRSLFGENLQDTSSLDRRRSYTIFHGIPLS